MNDTNDLKCEIDASETGGNSLTHFGVEDQIDKVKMIFIEFNIK